MPVSGVAPWSGGWRENHTPLGATEAVSAGPSGLLLPGPRPQFGDRYGIPKLCKVRGRQS